MMTLLAGLPAGLFARTVNVADYGAKPDDGQNDLPALRAALAEAKKEPGSTLSIPPGRYDLSEPEAVKLQETVLSGAWGNPQDRLFNRDYKYVTALDFSGAKKLTVEAAGATFLIDGWMEPVAIQNCRDITLRGLTIDFKRPPNSEGLVTAVRDGYAEVKFPDLFPVHEKLPMLRMMAYDEASAKLYEFSGFTPKAKQVAPQTLRFPCTNTALEGKTLLFWHGFHFRPAILIYEADNTRLEGVTLHANPGMGVVGHLAENIALERLAVIPAPGRHLSTNTDATHFVSCRGLIRFHDCRFGGQGDDSTNVHGFYTGIVSVGADGKSCVMDIGRRFETHSVKRDIPRVGDRVAVVKRETLEETGYITLKTVTPDPASFACAVTFDGELPKDFQNYTLFDLSACPRLEFVDCKVASHMARAVLIKTQGGALVEGCDFRDTTGTAIHIGAEGDWMEGPASKDVVIRNNTFSGCGTGNGTIDGASSVAVHVKAKRTDVPGLHRHIRIENNTVIGGGRAFTIHQAEDVVILGNDFQHTAKNPVFIANSRNIRLENNKGAANAPAPADTTVGVVQTREKYGPDTWLQRHEKILARNKKVKPEVVFLGDSITHFWSGEPASHRPTDEASWKIATGGRTATNLGFGFDYVENALWRIEHGELDDIAPKVIVVLLGTNNLGHKGDSPEAVARGMKKLLEVVRMKQPAAKILLLGVYPRSGDKVTAEIVALNALYAAMAGDGITYLDAGAALAKPGAAAKPYPRLEYFRDGLHPNAAGYAELAKRLAPVIEELLRRQP